MRAHVLALLLLLASCGEPAPKTEASPLQFDQTSAEAGGPGQSELRHGERLASVLGCRGCHGKDLTGHIWSDDPKEAVLWTSNLTRELRAYDDLELERALR